MERWVHTMITGLDLENYKAFGKRTRVEFSPITLIYGQNSAGKSSILNALNLLKQTRMSRDQGALLLPRAEGGIVDLGSFHELLHDHDATRTLSVALTMSEGRHLRGHQSFGIEVGFKRAHQGHDVTLAHLECRATSARGDRISMRFVPKKPTASETRLLQRNSFRWSHRRSPGQSHKLGQCVRVDVSEGYWRDHYDEVKKTCPSILEALRSLRADLSDGEGRQASLFGDLEIASAPLDAALEFYERPFTYEEFVARRLSAAREILVELDGFVPRPIRTGSSAFPEEMVLRGSERRRVGLSDESDLILRAGFALEEELEQLFPLGPYRTAPQRLYIFTGTTPLDVGYSGNLLPDLLFRRKNLVGDTNKWLDRLSVGYHIEIAPVGTASNDLFEVRLRDVRRKGETTVSIPDVGFGISQILPLIVQTLASERQTISIEQPEVHIHPRLQADLADLLIEGIRGERRHRFIVETHSEHLVLRLLRRIRETHEGQLPEGHPGLRPEELSVVFLERGENGAEVHHLAVDEQGEFLDEWPGGFFEERAKELF